MTIELTEEQRQAVRNGDAVRLTAPEIGEDVVLLRAADFEELRELLQEEREKEAIAQTALKSASRWAQENPF